MHVHPVIIVHGGAWAIPQHLWEPSIDGVKEAALQGLKVLMSGASALDAVEVAVTSLENNPSINAGTGSVLTYDEQVEMDALIMDGKSLGAGAIAAIKNIRNPIKVARKVLEQTPYVLLVGEGANKFAASQGIKEINPDLLVTQHAKNELAHYKKFNTTINVLFNGKTDIESTIGHDTVGCAALDQDGHVACATSTGGRTGKLPGRVGDSPLVGCGGYADDEIGAVSSTGHGEAITKICLAKSIIQKISAGESVSSASKSALKYMEQRIGGYGGAIVLSSRGEVAAEFTTEKMAWAYVKEKQLHFGLHIGQHEIEKISPEFFVK